MDIQIFIERLINSTSSVFLPSARDHAYLDPGSGSFILQLIIATLLGCLLVMRGYCKKILSALWNIFHNDQDKDGG
ncbi:hypothetical protein ACFLUC_02300 [Chloroflexota bacterium]